MDKAWLRAALQSMGATQADLARELHLAPSAISRILTGGRQIKAAEAAHMARYLGVPVEAILNELTQEGAVVPPSPLLRRGRPPRAVSADPREPWTLIPIHDSGAGADFLQADPVGYTSCPPNLAGVRDAYAVYVADDTMEPRYAPGWLLYVHPSKPPVLDRDVVVVKKDHHVVIRQLVTLHGGVPKLRQFNPLETFDIAMSEIVTLHLIVGVNHEG
jgi:phage repressor protein C with HTH and peptisase S24 domain